MEVVADGRRAPDLRPMVTHVVTLTSIVPGLEVEVLISAAALVGVFIHVLELEGETPIMKSLFEYLAAFW